MERLLNKGPRETQKLTKEYAIGNHDELSEMLFMTRLSEINYIWREGTEEYFYDWTKNMKKSVIVITIDIGLTKRISPFTSFMSPKNRLLQYQKYKQYDFTKDRTNRNIGAIGIFVLFNLNNQDGPPNEKIH